MSLGLRPISLSCNILIHPTIWPQQIWAENSVLCPFGEGSCLIISSTIGNMFSTGFFRNLTATNIVFALDGITFLYQLKLMIATF